MNTNQNTKTLVKILIGTAWLDGKMQPDERQYLHQIATQEGVADDSEIQPLLHELRDIKPEECYEWIREYLGDQPSSESCLALIEAVSALIYSDGTIADEEAKLLVRLQSLDSSTEAPKSIFDKVLAEVRTLYRRGTSKL